MSTHRTSIVSAMVDLIKEEMNGTQTDKYYTNIYDNVSDSILHFDEITDFPFISIAKGPESPEYQPGGFRWNFLDLYARVYVRGNDDGDEQLEKLLTDLKTFIDTTESFTYNITKPDGSVTEKRVTEINWVEIGTDEGLLKPDAFGEIRLRVRYEDTNAIYCM